VLLSAPLTLTEVAYDAWGPAPGSEQPLLLDLYLPGEVSRSPYPLLVYLPEEGGRMDDAVIPVADLAARRGYALAAVDRRPSEAGSPAGGVDEATRATAFLRAHAAEYGIDPQRVGVLSSSTPGHPGEIPDAATRAALRPVQPRYGALHSRVVVIDPGHQARGDYTLEPIGPGSSTRKPKVSSGTRGVVTGTPESQLVLAVSLMVRDELERRGVQVIMTRTTQNVNISNIERTLIANRAGADLYLRVHADGHSDSRAHGIHTMYPAVISGWTDDIAVPSRRAAELIQTALIAATGAHDRGIDARSDMTGFNWSDVPAVIPEIGFMTNPAETVCSRSPRTSRRSQEHLPLAPFASWRSCPRCPTGSSVSSMR
jgi:N-acetylmuramoyl-L-alanine amidase